MGRDQTVRHPVPWSKGKYTTWDITSIHTCAASYIRLTSATAGSAGELTASRKVKKYADHPATHNFVPIAIGIASLGPVNTYSWSRIHQRIRTTDDSRNR